MARYEIPVITVVFNNYSYNGVKNRSLELGAQARGRMRDTGKIPHVYLGDPKMKMTDLARGFGVSGEFIGDPKDIKAAMNRAIAATRDGKPYLIDVAVARTGAFADNPWYQKISIAEQRTRKV
jgi:thiamine pyrophosphate-dependent acetolactate synthase large subunit-like protein